LVSGLFAIPKLASSCAPAAANDAAALRPQRFVAGPENALLSRALAAMHDPSPATNPLVITGMSGSGKSLILELLVAEFQRHFAGVAVLSTTAVDLARAYAHAVQTDSVGEFRHRHSRLQLLAIDDVQRIADKGAAQQELRQLIDSLASRGCLVVATLRTHPLQTAELSPSLASRLSAGLVIPLSLPGYAARRALLTHFAAEADVGLPQSALERLAPVGAALPQLATAPQLRRAVIRLGEQALPGGGKIDRSIIDTFLKADGSVSPSLKAIAAGVAKHFGVTVGDLRSNSRQHSLTAVRGLAIHLARELTGLSYAQIGRYFGNRDHTTVMYACKKATKAMADEPQLQRAVDELKLQLSAEEATA
jgi:chromosomal replication initiator protein